MSRRYVLTLPSWFARGLLGSILPTRRLISSARISSILVRARLIFRLDSETPRQRRAVSRIFGVLMTSVRF
ncbi:hypothetical protein F5B18DRAFT_618736 [Nemania serpens]|nr:hypothetical protein F5B18DRAFT_618736 [Nemania serpens]